MTYDVALVYNFSRENMSRDSADMTNKIAESLTEFLHKIGMNVYDENKERNELQRKSTCDYLVMTCFLIHGMGGMVLIG